MGRPGNSLPGRREHCRTVRAWQAPKRSIEQGTGIHIPHNIVHEIMRENDLAERNPKKSQRCKSEVENVLLPHTLQIIF